jgi:hypothetical protein
MSGIQTTIRSRSDVISLDKSVVYVSRVQYLKKQTTLAESDQAGA